MDFISTKGKGLELCLEQRISASFQITSRQFILYSRTPLIPILVIRNANYPNWLGLSGIHFLTVIVLHLFMA